MISIKPYCRTDQIRKDGKNLVSIHIFKTGYPRKKLNTDLLIEPKYFNNTSGKFTKGSGNALKLNARLDEILSDLRNFVLDNPESLPQDVATYFLHTSPENFILYFKEELWKERHGIALRTFKLYKYCVELAEKNWPGLNQNFVELTEDNLRQLDYALRMGGLSRTTIHHTLSVLRKYTKRAFKQGKVKKNPFDDFKIVGMQAAEKEWTDLDEIERLKDLFTNKADIPRRLHSTLIHYLHSCHCGLRASDARNFRTKEHIKKGFISMVLSKTSHISQTPVRIPINDYAKELHSYIDDYPLHESHKKLGEDIKELCALAGIDKHITFHCSRHSFAINSLIKGVRLEVVSKWLGHSQLSTTRAKLRINMWSYFHIFKGLKTLPYEPNILSTQSPSKTSN